MTNISDIYRRYGIPDGLQMHMLRVAAIADQILSRWHGPSINHESLKRVLLIHDMGNIVKMDPELDESEQARVVCEGYISKFGKNDHRISLEIARELRLTGEELTLMDGKIFIRNDETMASQDYARKIGAYADQRAAPGAVNPLLIRLREAQRRYRDKPGSSMNNPRTDMLIECAVKIEKQVMEHCNLEPDDITDDSVAPFIENLRTFVIGAP